MHRFLAFVAFLMLGSCEFGPKVHHITAPKLSDEHLGKRFFGLRPWRSAGPNMSIEEIDGKIVVHNYGHGGAGWVLFLGRCPRLF